jgi:outer membrane protein
MSKQSWLSQRRSCQLASLLLAIATSPTSLHLPSWAQSSSPAAEVQLAPSQSAPSQLAPSSSPSIPSRDRLRVELTLAEVVDLLVQNNRELKNAALDRIVKRQQLREAKSTFVPKLQPSLGIGVSQFFSATPAGSGPARSFAPEANLDSSSQLTGRWKTPIGTTLTVTTNPLLTQKVSVTISQPLLRGNGLAINTAPIKKAELTETSHRLALEQALITKITQASTAYWAIARAQAMLRIQQISLQNQQQQQETIQILINASRRPPSELLDVEANMAATQTQVLTAQNTLAEAKINLLTLLDLETEIDVEVPPALLAELRASRMPAELKPQPSLDTLLETAYRQRPDYQQAQLATQIAALDLEMAKDNKQWGLDLRATSSFGDTAQAAVGINLTRVLSDQSLETAFQRSRVDQLKRNNDLTNLKDGLRLEVENCYRAVLSSRDRTVAARAARELATQRLLMTQLKFQLGEAGLFQVLALQNSLVTAQTEEIRAKIDFLEALSQLEQATGTTLDTWKPQLNRTHLPGKSKVGDRK